MSNPKKERWVPAWMKAQGVKEAVTLSTAELDRWCEPWQGNFLPDRLLAFLMLAVNDNRSEDGLAVRYEGNRRSMFYGQLIPMTPGDIGNGLLTRAVKCYERVYKRKLTPPEVKAIARSLDKTSIRRALATLEDAGYIERRTDTGRRLRDLEPRERQALSPSQIRIHKFYQPKEISVKLLPDPRTVPTDGSRQVVPTEIDAMFDAMVLEAKRIGLKVPKQLALPFAEIPDPLREAYEELKKAEERFKQIFSNSLTPEGNPAPQSSSSIEGRVVETPAGNTTTPESSPGGRPGSFSPTSTTAENGDGRRRDRVPPEPEGAADQFTAEEFHRKIQASFQECGLPLPTRPQNRKFYDEAGEHAQAFAEAVTVQVLRTRKARNPGILTGLLEEFLAVAAGRKAAKKAEQPAPAAPSCKRCGDGGLIGSVFESVEQAAKAVRQGATYCDCKEGALARDLVQPYMMRAAASG